MRTTTALVALHVAVALFGFAALFGKWIALSPVAIVFGRTIVAAIALVLYARWTRATLLRPSFALCANGALLALHWIAFFAAVQLATVAIALLGFATFPVFVVVLERVLHERRPTRIELAAVVLVVLGLALLAPDSTFESRSVRGLAWGIAAGFTFALLAVRNLSLVPDLGSTPLALWQNAFAALWLAPIVALTAESSLPTASDIMLIVLLGLLCTALAHTLFIASMLRVTAHTASIVSILEPIYGIAWAALLLGEWPDGRTLAAGTLIIGAAVIATSGAARRGLDADQSPLR